MGIPYYFASLIRQHKGIVNRVHDGMTTDILAIDFNCLIHTYMDDSKPIESIIVALRDLTTKVCKATKHVYIAMDGLVPYGKLVQQRYRRFRKSDVTPIFDRHQISPETSYMKELSEEVRKSFPSAILSDTSEPGEGEHKLLNWLKTLDPKMRRSITVYGLDADLILLCLAQKKLSMPYSFNLLRENANFSKDIPGYSTMSVWKLADKIDIPVEQYLRMCVMCFGNDFMPNIGIFSLREGGHDRALKYYAEAGNPDLTTQEGMFMFLRTAASHEISVLKDIVERRNKPFERMIFGGDGRYLKERYQLHMLDGVEDVKPIVCAFYKSYEWTLSYFLENRVPDWNWVYPYADAPLLGHLMDVNMVERPKFEDKLTFKPLNQLQFILPSASLKKNKKRVLFPDEFYNEETETRLQWMKRYAWECKPRISLPWNPIEKETRIEAFQMVK